jgi:filamentous hemagglutinin family protein
MMTMSKSTRINRRNPRTSARMHATPALVTPLPLRKTWPISLCVGLVVGSIVFSSDALAGGPTGGVVVGGSGTITQSGNNTVINQASSRLALNWQTFNVGANESVLFNQPSRSAVALNRILDQNPSQIFGRINSNGQIFLINTHGIIFGATAQMNVGGLLASTLDLTPNDFLAGHYNLNAIGPAAGVVNHGVIQAASGGSVSLVGGSVLNDGLIFANYGKINLDGADHATLDFDGNGLINIQITGELKQRLDAKEAAVTNKGKLSAEDGTVVLQAAATKDLFTQLVNNSGVIDASGISTDGGVVRLVASGGNTENSGTINTSGKHGGRVELLSDKDVMVTGGTLDASGTQGGGAIRVGGGVRGGEGLVIADRTYVADGAMLNADATGSGNGGSIAVFSQNNSVIAGGLSARGGVGGGNGGFVETSSRGGLTVTGTPQVTARNASGFGGDWLIDPNNINIVAGGGSTSINTANPFLSTNDGASLGVNLITAALTGGANVTVTTGSGGTNAEAGDITLNADLNYNGKGTNALTFNAAHDIVINNKIFDSTPSVGDVLNLSLIAGNNISLANDISLGGGSATLTATAGGITQTAGKLLSAGTLNATAATGIGLNTAATLLNVINTGATGNIAITEADGATVQALQQTNAANTAGTVSLTSTTGNIGIDDGSVLSQGGLITLTATAGAITDADGGTAASITNAGGQATLGAAAGIGAAGVGNEIDTQVGTLAFANSGAGGVSVTDADALTVSGTAGSGNVGITSTTGDLTVNGNIGTTGNVALTASAGNIVRTAGTISGNALTLTAAGTNGAIGAAGAILTDVSSVAFSANGTGAVNITEANGANVSGTAGSGNVGVTSTTGDLTVNGNISTTGNVALTASAGNIVRSAGTISGNALTLTAAGTNGAIGAAGAILTNASSIAFSANGTGAINITEANGANVSGTAGSGNVGITSTTADLGVVASGITTAGGAVTLKAAGGGARINIGAGATVDTTNAGAVTAGADVSLIADNADIFGTVNAGTAGTVAILQSTAGRQISLGVDAPPGPPRLGLTGTELDQITANTIVIGDAFSGDLGIFAPIAPAHAANLSLNTGGAISQATGATITVGTLTGSSVGATTLGEANVIGTLGNFSAAGFSLTNAAALDVTGAVNGGNSASLTTSTGDLTISGSVAGTTTTLGAAGAISETAGGVITATTLNGTAVNSSSLAGTGNQIQQLGSFSVTGVGQGLSVLNNRALDVTGPVSVGAGGDIALTTSAGALTIDSALIGGAVSLTGNAGLALNANVSAATLTLVSSAGGISQGVGSNVLATGNTSINGGSGAVSLTSGGNDFQGAVTATGAGVSLVDVNDLNVASLTDNANGNVSLIAGGALTLPASALSAGTGNLTLAANGGVLSTSGALSGTNVSLTGHNGVMLGGDVTALGTLALASTNAAITQLSGAITTAGLSTVTAGTGAITLTGAGNNFTGAVSLTGGAAQITDGGALTLGTLSTTGALTAISTGALNLGSGSVGGNLDATSNNGAISQAGALSVSGTSALNAGNGAITLTNANNDFQSAVTATGAGVSLVDVNDLNVASLTDNANGNVSLIAGGALTLPASALSAGTGNLTLAANGGVLSTSGALSGTNVSLTGHNGVMLGGDVTALGTLTLASTNAAITQLSGAITTAGLSTVTAGTGAITLTGAGNNFTGAVSLTGGAAQITDGGALTLGTLNTTGALTAISTGALNLGSGSVGGNLVATSNNGAISQTGALSVTGTSALNAGSGSITLTNGGNNFTGAVSLTGGITQITDANALTLGTLNTTGALTAISTGALNLGSGSVGGNLDATSNNGAISQTGALSVSGTSALNAGSGAITLTDGGNNFTGAVSLTGGITQITDANALTLGTLNTTGALIAISTGSLNLGSGSVGGNLDATSNNGAISQTGALSVTGTSALNAGSGAITLTDGGNDFTGAVSLIGGIIQITDANTLTLGTLSTGALTAISTGALNLGSGGVGGNLVATSNNGAISQTGALSVTGSSALNAGSGSITLANGGNDFQGAVTATGAGVSLVDVNDLAIAGLSGGANGAVSLIAGGVLALPAGSIDTGTANLTLASNGGSLTTPGALSGANISLTGRDGVTLNNDVTASGALNLVSGAAINQGAGIITAGTLTGGSVGSAALNQANRIGTLGSFSAANFSLTNAQALTVSGPLTTTGNSGDISLTTTSGVLAVDADLQGAAVALTSVDNLALSRNLTGTTVALMSGGNINQSAGIITAGSLSGSSVGTTTLNGANMVGTLGSFSATSFALTNAQTLSVTGPVSGGASTTLTTTAGNLAINGAVSGITTTLKSAAAISEGAGGSITANTLNGQSVGATSLTGANHIGTLGSFSAAGFGLTNAQTLAVTGPVNGGVSTALTTTAGDLAINGAVSGATTTLKSAGAISEGAGGVITATTLNGQSAGATSLTGVNHVNTLGGFSAAGFGLTNAQALTVSGPVNGGTSTTLTTTAGDLAINGAVSGTTTTLKSAGAISEGAGGGITANLLTGHSVGNATLDGNNHINTLGSFTSDFSLTNAQTLTVVGPLDGGPSVTLTTTAGDLVINGAITGTTTTLKSAGAISEGAAGSIFASTLNGQSVGATNLNGTNHIGTLGSFRASNFSLTNAQALTVGGSVSGGASTALTTTAGDLAINGAVSGTSTTLKSAGAITEGAGGVITAGTLSGQAAGTTTLGSATRRINNMVSTLGNFSSPAGFSMTNNKTLTLASVAGSAFTVNAGTSAFYLSVTNGDLFQLGTTPVYDGMGVWGSTGRMGTGSAPIYVVGTGLQTIANVGMPPAYFYAIDSSGNLLPLGGGLAVNVPTASGAGSAQNGNHGDSYIDPSVITANYRSYGIVPSGVRLPADQQSGCDPDQPDQTDCQEDTVGMVGMMLNARR